MDKGTVKKPFIKGPYEYHIGEDYCYIYADAVSAPGAPSPLAEVFSTGDDKELRATAGLLSIAPELLDVLEEVLIIDLDHDPESRNLPPELVKKCQKLIRIAYLT